MKLDSDGKPPTFKQGDRVYIGPLKAEGTIHEQLLHHDCGETFWGNVRVITDAGEKVECHGWQVKRIAAGTEEEP